MTEPDRFEGVRDFYDQQYHGDPQRQGSGKVPWHVRMVAGRLGTMSGTHVLDVACGQGEWLAELSRRGALVSGTDISSRAIERCRQRLPAGHFQVSPAETLPFADGSFDLVTCLGSLEHFLDRPAALAEMTRVAATDAQFLFLVPIAGFLTRRLGLYKGTEQVSIREDVLEIGEWERLFDNAGLRILARWRDLHTLSLDWINRGPALARVLRAAQACALPLWPIGWQYQVYFLCDRRGAGSPA